MTGSGLAAEVAFDAGVFELDVRLAVAPGSTVAVLGPNGAGKTTLLRALAGLRRIERGRVVLAGRVLDDPSAGVFVEPESRRVGVVFQDLALFPHLSALDNVAFALRVRGQPRHAARDEAAHWLARLGLDQPQMQRRPRQLSGGEAQRVALARALVAGPDLLLLDEPLSALDAAARGEARRLIRRHLEGHEGARVIVTHDPVEAAVLAEHVVVVERGRVVQQGRPADIAARPRSRYVADLAGVNLLRGSAAGRTAVALPGGFRLTVAEPVAGEVLAVVHPRAVALHTSEPEGTPRNVWPAEVAGVDLEGDRVRVQLAGALPLVAEVTEAARAGLGIERGGRVWASVKATEVTVYPA